MTKPIRYIDKVKNPLVRPCPGAKNHYCCNYVIVSQILNCPYNCSYCFLHTFFGQDEIVVYNNHEQILKEVKEYLDNSDVPLHLGTGEYSDSLILPDAVALAKKLIAYFATQDRHLLELKTKSTNIKELLDLEHNGKTVIAWSVNPEKIAQEEEHGAPSLILRLAAAKECAEAGYPVAFHFDPIIYYPGWEKDYVQVVEGIFKAVKEKDIAWISLGALRFPAAQKEIMTTKFKTKIPFDELKVGVEDNKLRYSEELRIKLFKHLYKLIRSKSAFVYVYLCMESEAVWQVVNIENAATIASKNIPIKPRKLI